VEGKLIHNDQSRVNPSNEQGLAVVRVYPDTANTKFSCGSPYRMSSRAVQIPLDEHLASEIIRNDSLAPDAAADAAFVQAKDAFNLAIGSLKKLSVGLNVLECSAGFG
jgi:hypothetical protein